MASESTDSLCEERFYEHFFKSNAKALRNYLCAKFGSMDLAEDIVQDAFIKLWDNCVKVTPETAKSYLYTIANNLGISNKRHDQVKFKHQNLVVHQDNSLTNESPEFILLEKEFETKFKLAISDLPERQREVFLLSRVEKKTYKEIAELQEVSVKAIEKLMHKALLKLRNSLDGVNL